MRVRILGSVEVGDGVVWRTVTGSRCCGVLAAVVAHAPGAVGVGEIADEVWGETPPRSAATQVHGYVAKLRRLLGDQDRTVLLRSGAGYVLDTRHGVDAQIFEAGARSGLDAFRAGRLEEASGLLDGALELWRGEPFGGLAAGPSARATSLRLDNLRLSALETRLEIRLDRGEHAAVLDELQDQVSRHPLREHLWRLLLVALYRSGRDAEALRGYADLRRILADELGADPSPVTQEVHQRILDRSLPPAPLPRVASPPTAADSGASPPAVVPEPVHQLPSGVPDFSGRSGELGVLRSYLDEHDAPDAPAVVVLSGAPGTGKSALALHLARTVRDRYPDAQLHLDLAGTSLAPREEPELVATLLHSLGQFGHRLPDSAEARTAVLRAQLAARRTLLVLDDAAYAAQVLPLLPPNGASAVVVTSRNTLGDLPGARHLQLGALAPAEAEELFAGIVGAERAAREPEESRAIAELCGHLPLSVRIAGGKLLGRPTWPLRELRVRLADESRRLAELSLGHLDVRASVDLSLRSLPSRAVLGFELLGLLGPHDQPAWVVGALLGDGEHEPVLDRLVDGGLLQLVRQDAVGQTRYRMHDLLRMHARELAVARGVGVCREAVDRLVAGWTARADAVRHDLPPSLFDPLPGEPAASGAGASVRAAAGARLDAARWLATERRTVLDALGLAAGYGLGAAAARLAGTLAPLYDQQALYDDWRTSHEIALTCGGLDPLARGPLLRGLGQALIYADELDLARDRLAEAQAAYEDRGHRVGAALALAGLATVDRCLDRPDEAERRLARALDLMAGSGDAPHEAALRGGMGRVLMVQGRRRDALPWLESALALAEECGDLHREAVVLRDVGTLRHELGRSGEAVRTLDRAVLLFRRLGDEQCVAMTLVVLGTVLSGRQRASGILNEAAEIFRRNGMHDDERLARELRSA